jgi:hypothetical protein
MSELPVENREESLKVSDRFEGEPQETHYQRDDERWSAGRQIKDWGILIVMILIYLTWTGLIYLLEPGIR